MVDFENGKLFVGGIPWDTTPATLSNYFSRYGEVSFSTIAKDRSSGKPRGFAFVSFFDPASALKALDDHHEISGKTVEVKRAKSRSVQPIQQSQKESSISTINSSFDSRFRAKKIFVGGLSASVTEEEFRSYFEKFGRVTDVVVMYDNVTNRPRGFGFITFDSEDVVERITSNSFHVLAGKYVEVKRAIPKETSRSPSNGQNSSSGGGLAASPYWGRDNVNPGFYPRHGYGEVYGGGYQMAWPGYGPVGYRMPLVGAPNHWNGLGMVGYGHAPSPVYPMNLVSGGGPFGMCNGVDNSVEIGKSVPRGGDNGSARFNYNESSIPKTHKRSHRQRSFDRKQMSLTSEYSS